MFDDDDRRDFAADYARDAANEVRRIHPEEMTEDQLRAARIQRARDLSGVLLDVANRIRHIELMSANYRVPGQIAPETLRVLCVPALQDLRKAQTTIDEILELDGEP